MGILQRRSEPPASDRPSNGPNSSELGNTFADRFYGARDEGERLHGTVVAWLNANPPDGGSPGSSHPDPRHPGSWSWTRMVTAAATDYFGIGIDYATNESAEYADQCLPPLPRRKLRRAWVVVPPHHPRVPARPVLEVRREESNDWEVYLETYFQIAMVLCYLTENPDVLDPTAHAGYFVGSTDSHATTRMHQFAIAFLKDPLKPDYCHPSWNCQCNRTRAAYDSAPPEHARPTDALMRQEIGRQLWPQREKIIPIRGTPHTPVEPSPGRGTVWTNPNLGGGGRTTAS